MLQPYFNLSPSTFVCFTRSLPAKSTILILDLLNLIESSSSISDSILIVKIVCDLELYLFMPVSAIFRFF